MSHAKKKSKKRTSRLKTNAKRLAAYSAAAAATVMATGERSANADVVYFGNVDVTSIGGTAGILFNVTTGNVSNVGSSLTSFSNSGSFRLVGSDDLGSSIGFLYGPAFSSSALFLVSSGTYASRLGLGDPIGGTGNFNGGGGYPSVGFYANLSNWGPGDRGFLGFQFLLGGDLHYGYADITKVAAGEVTLHAFGYETLPDTTITAGDTGAVPEPSSVMLLAAGAAGIGMFRRRRKAA